MSAVKELYLQTRALIEFVAQFPEDNDERDQFIMDLNEKLDSREQVIKEVDGEALSDDEKKLGQELVKLNKKLTERLEEIRTAIRLNIAKLEEKKATGLKYENPYDGPSSDGIFFDKQS